MPTPQINLDTFADGALKERANETIRQVLANIADPNTDAKKKRSVTITLHFTGNEQRNLASVDIEAKAKLVPARSVGTSVLIDEDLNGLVVGQELVSGIKGQTMIADSGEIVTDVGQPIDEVEENNNIVDFRKTQNN